MMVSERSKKGSDLTVKNNGNEMQYKKCCNFLLVVYILDWNDL